MPLMWKESIEAASTSYPGMHFLTEDPRPGHNVMYFGYGKNAYDSVSLKPLWGLSGTFKEDTGSSYYGGSFSLNSSNGNHEQNTRTYMLLAGAHPMGYGRNNYITGITTNFWYNNCPISSFGNMDTEQRPTQHFIKDNGDGTHTLMIHSMELGAAVGAEFYSDQYHYNSIPNDLELYDVAPTYHYNTTTPSGWRGIPCGYSALDGSNSGFLTMSNLNNTSYPTLAYLASHIPGSSVQGEANGGSTSSTSGYYSQFAGMSRSDGLPIFFEYRHSWYTAFFRVTKYTGNAWTTLLSAPNNGVNNSPAWTYLSTSYSYASGTDSGNAASGTGDSQPRFASCWFRHGSQPANMYYTVVPWGYAGVPYCDIIRWDRATDTFAGAGAQNVSTTYASAYHRYGNSNGWQSFAPYVAVPFESRREEGLTTTTSSGHSGTEQAFAYAIAADAHGFASADGSTESPFETEQYPDGGNTLPVSFFNMSVVDGAFDGNTKGRAMFATTVYSNGAAYNSYHQGRAVTWVPETPLDWVWCDSGKTTIAAICKNSTYIYQCRKGSSLTDGGQTGNVMLPNNGGGDQDTSVFNNTVNAFSLGWIHTATIPYQVLQMGIDKHDRLWYITASAAGPYYAQSSANDTTYHKQMWMLTTATPHKVNLTGNATTDTISYSGSNIDKTLTIEALNFKGQRLAKTITLNITSTNAQFDNGSQTKDVTTSASATVNETITVTGAGSFNITAAYGA